MKTVKQHLKEKLTTELYDKAMANVTHKEWLDKEIGSPSGAIASAFVWTLSNERFDFWENVFDNLLTDEDAYVKK